MNEVLRWNLAVKTIETVATCLVAACVLWHSVEFCRAEDAKAPPALSPDLKEIVRLSQAQVNDDVIVAYVKKSGKSYPLGAEEIIYLKNQGISQTVISALLESQPATASPAPPLAAVNPVSVPAVTTPAPQPALPGMTPGAPPSTPAPGAPPPGAESQVSLDYFHTQLAPYGAWVEVPGYGLCWSPTRVIASTPGGDWRPYYDNGHWTYTENGWFWVSDYSWGDIPFHYGRWIREPGHGWLWVPDLTWGPAWVCWRHAEADGYIGWAPLPYGAVWIDGGWRYHGHAVVEVGFDFGLGEDFFVFVGHDHFHDHYFRYRSRYDYPFHLHREVIHGFYGRTVIRNEFRRDEHGRFVNEGLGRERIEHVTGRKVEMAHFEERRPVVRAEHSVANRTTTSQSGATPESAHASSPAANPDASKVYRPPVAAQKTATTPKTSAPAAKTQKK